MGCSPGSCSRDRVSGRSPGPCRRAEVLAALRERSRPGFIYLYKPELFPGHFTHRSLSAKDSAFCLYWIPVCGNTGILLHLALWPCQVLGDGAPPSWGRRLKPLLWFSQGVLIRSQVGAGWSLPSLDWSLSWKSRLFTPSRGTSGCSLRRFKRTGDGRYTLTSTPVLVKPL